MLGLLLALFFVSSLILSAGVPDMYNSPDERAAAVSIEAFIRDNHFSVSEPLNPEFGGVLAPRSMVSAPRQGSGQVGDSLVPITFPGLPLFYGIVGKAMSFPLTKFLTPLLAVLAVLAWRKTLESFLSRRASLIASILLLTLAGFWFYSARAFMHNVPFLAFLIFGFFFLSRKGFRPRDAILAGLMFGLALLFRTSEIVWMSLVGLVFLVAFVRKIRFKPLALFLAALVIGLSPLFFWNQAHFGSSWQFGYTVSAPVFSPPKLSEPLPAKIVASPPSRAMLSQMLFPFGFHPRTAWKNFVDYQLELTWWMTGLAVLGLVFLVMGSGLDFGHSPKSTKSRPDPKICTFAKICTMPKMLRAILLATFFAGGYLTFLYGSWNIIDNPDPGVVTLANSYVRYWLPIYLVSTIPAALFIEWLAGRARTLLSQRLVIGSVLLLVSALSIRLVFFHPDDGLVRTRAVLFESIEIRDELLARTQPESVIIVDYADKILFPHRRVVVPLRSQATYDALPSIVERLPTYYYGITLPESDLDHLNQEILSPRGLTAEPITTINIETLYRIHTL